MSAGRLFLLCDMDRFRLTDTDITGRCADRDPAASAADLIVMVIVSDRFFRVRETDIAGQGFHIDPAVSKIDLDIHVSALGADQRFLAAIDETYLLITGGR